MKYILVLLCAYFFSILGCVAQDNIAFEVRWADGYQLKNNKIRFFDPDSISHNDYNSMHEISPRVTGNLLQVNVKSKKLLCFSFDGLDIQNVPLEPGDNIVIEISNAGHRYSGKGADKIKMIYEINEAYKNLPAMDSHWTTRPKSFSEFRKWERNWDRQDSVTFKFLKKYLKKIPPQICDRMKTGLIADIEVKRIRQVLKIVSSNLINENQKIHLLDSAFNLDNHKWLLKDKYTPVTYLWETVLLTQHASFGFSYDNKLKLQRRRFWIDWTGEHLSEPNRSKLLSYFVQEQIMGEMGFTDETEPLISTTYSLMTDSRWENWLKRQELLLRTKYKGVFIPNFSLTDVNGKRFTKADLKGKVALFNFWHTGSKECLKMAPFLAKVEAHFKNDTNVVFLNISVDENKNQWLNSIKERKYTSGNGIHLYTEGKGVKHSMITDFDVKAYPKLYLIGAYGVPYNHTLPDLRSDIGTDEMIRTIGSAALSKTDGPYVFWKGDSLETYRVFGEQFKKENGFDGVVSTDEYLKPLRFKIQDKIITNLAESPKIERIFALSDIEGNFDKLRTLLQKNGVIDSVLNWSFGDGGLVFSGDMFDRGNQVTECLWLVYSLEEKARAKGGQVHFILGNHEIMNLQGNHRYITKKYENTSVILGKTIAQLYGEDSELGRWLRTKNIVEKIGSLLFMHGGLSPEINNSSLSISDINKLARPYYSVLKDNYGDAKTNLVMSTSKGPFWYRGYYEESDKHVEKSIDSILLKYSARHLVTGHTIVADTISALYNNKVINTDVPHAKGKSEALLIEGNNYYRVNDKGQRWLLFKDPESLLKDDKSKKP